MTNLMSGCPAGYSLVIGDHQLLQPIASGSYGEVWLARNALGTLRALKIVRRQTFEKDTHFEREFKGLQKFEPISRAHPGLVNILHLGRNDAEGYFYYVMELADAAESAQLQNGSAAAKEYRPRTLRNELATRGALPFRECVSIALTLASALEHLHSNNLVHRDIKPSNIIFVNGVPKLADIGLVVETNDARSFVGTEGYIPPEGPGTEQADIYSFGKVLYEMSTGQDRHEFPRLPENLAERDEVLELNAVILKCCKNDLRHRYGSVSNIHADLSLLKGGKSVKLKERRIRSRNLGRRLFVGAAVLSTVLIGTISLFKSGFRITFGGSTPVEEFFKKTGTTNQEAYELFERGRAILNHANAESWTNGIRLITRALERDPHYVRVWGELFRANIDGGATGKAKQREIAGELRKLDKRSSDSAMADAWLAYEDFDFAKADKEFRRAIQSEATNPICHEMYGCFLMQCGRLGEARRHLQLTQRLDPARWTTQLLGDCYFLKRDYTNAIACYEEALRLEPQDAGAFLRLGRALEAKKDFRNALAAFERMRCLMGEDPITAKRTHEELRQAYLDGSENGYWEKRLEQARLKSNEEEQSFPHAFYYARLGQHERALHLLEEAWRKKDFELKFLLLEQHWDSLRGHPRFTKLLKEIGYEPRSQ